MVAQFAVVLAPDEIERKVVSLQAALSNVTDNVSISIPTADLLFYDDTFLTLAVNRPPGGCCIVFAVSGFVGDDNATYLLQHSPTLSPPNWTNFPPSRAAYFDRDMGISYQFYIPTNQILKGFYRGTK